MVSPCGYETVGAQHILIMITGLLIYIPGFSEDGILLALAGGSNETFVSTPGFGLCIMANSSIRRR